MKKAEFLSVGKPGKSKNVPLFPPCIVGIKPWKLDSQQNGPLPVLLTLHIYSKLKEGK